MRDAVLVLMPLATLAIGVWSGIRIERRRRNREFDDLLGR